MNDCGTCGKPTNGLYCDECYEEELWDDYEKQYWADQWKIIGDEYFRTLEEEQPE